MPSPSSRNDSSGAWSRTKKRLQAENNLLREKCDKSENHSLAVINLTNDKKRLQEDNELLKVKCERYKRKARQLEQQIQGNLDKELKRAEKLYRKNKKSKKQDKKLTK